MKEDRKEYDGYSLERILHDLNRDERENASILLERLKKLKSYLLSLDIYNAYEQKVDRILDYISNGEVDSVKLFIEREKEFEINKPYDEDGWHFLLYAAMEGQEQIVKLLVAMGADVNLESTEFEPQSALKLAVEERHYKVIKFLNYITNSEIKEKVRKLYPDYPSWI